MFNTFTLLRFLYEKSHPQKVKDHVFLHFGKIPVYPCIIHDLKTEWYSGNKNVVIVVGTVCSFLL